MALLPWTIPLSFLGALACWLLGARSARAARWMALIAAVSGLACTGIAALGFDPMAGPVELIDWAWIPAVGARFHLTADGISLTLVLLTGIAAVCGVLFSWNVTDRVGEFFGFYFLLLGGVHGVFLSADAFLFFVFYEVAIVPKYFLIAGWGSTNREYGAMKLVLYSFFGSALVLAGLLWAWAAAGGESFAMGDLAAAMQPGAAGRAMFALVFFGFAVLAGLFPLHTWAPTGHVAAPTAASMLLAGVVMKLGAYGCLRIAIPLFPAAFAFWQPAIAWLAVIGIVYAGLVALVQDDFKFVIGYSSVSHMGFVMLGLAAARPPAVAGAVLQMFSHGVLAGLLFAVVGRMVYDRTHTRELEQLRRRPLYRTMPFAATTFVLAGLASMGMPGFSGFPAELSILIGAWRTAPAWGFVAALGVLVAAAYTLRAIQLSFFGSREAEAERHPAGRPEDRATVPERIGALILLATTILIGCQPGLLLDWIVPSLNAPWWQQAVEGMAR